MKRINKVLEFKENVPQNVKSALINPEIIGRKSG